MAIRALIFDLGGVLLRTEDQSPREQLAARLGIPKDKLYYQVFESESARLAMIGKMSAEAHWESVRVALGISSGAFQEVRAEFWAGDRLDKDLVDYLGSLRPRYQTALLSNAWDDLRGIIERTWKISDAFDEMIISAEVGIAKPDPRIYQLAVDCLGVRPGEAVFVDDFIENIDSARAFGLQVVHFRGNQQLREDLNVILNGR